ncbi:MAG: hypothetical protein ACF8R7_05780 [Phycisphaerales bacterium JB039]
MRQIPVLVTLAALAAAAALAQDEGHGQPADPAPRSYMVTLCEFRMPAGDDPSVAAKEILRAFVQQRADGSLDLINTARVGVLEGEEARLQFGRTKTVATGVRMEQRGGMAQALERRDVGTLVQLTASDLGGQVRLQLSYEASRLEAQDAETGIAETLTVRFDTTVLLQPGAPALIGGNSADPARYLLVSIEP